MGEDTERYNPILDAKQDVNKDAQSLDCVHEMNTINHYVGMFPIATGAPVEKPLAKFFFGFFAVMLIAFAITQKKLRLLVLCGGLCRRCRLGGGRPVRAWPSGQPRQGLHGRSGHLLQGTRQDQGLGRQRHPGQQNRHRRPDRRHGDRRGGRLEDSASSNCCWPWCRRCCRCSSSSSTPAGCGSSATTCTPGAPSPSSPSCRRCSARARWRSSRPTPIPIGAMPCCMVVFVCLMLALLIRRKQLRAERPN